MSAIDMGASAPPSRPPTLISVSKTTFWVITAVVGALLVAAIVTIVVLASKIGSNSSSLSPADQTSFPVWNTEEETFVYSRYGRWRTVVPMDKSASVREFLGMQTVHTVLLPSGRVLIASGSSWRNDATVEMYPFNPDPASGNGLYGQPNTFPFSFHNADSYYSMVNAAGVYDPVENTFFRVPHPAPVQADSYNTSNFLPTDLFCSGQMHLPDGNVLWVGGTQYYTPYRTGARTTHIFDWKRELATNWTTVDWTVTPNGTEEFYPWQWAGATRKGRWYTHAVPLLDGRLVWFSGYVSIDPLTPDMYQFEINSDVEIFNYEAFKSSGPQSAWKVIDAGTTPNSPFQTPLPHSSWPGAATACSIPRQCLDYQNDSFKLYPHNYLLPDGKIYLTREGDWNSLRAPGLQAIRRTQYTYYMKVGGTKDAPNISFEPGPLRLASATISGTTVLDPNTGNSRINLFGGMVLNTSGTMLPAYLDSDDPLSVGTTRDANLTSQYAGSRGSRRFEYFDITAAEWILVDDEFLGPSSAFDRTMHYALILPTLQLLIIGGGNFDYADAVTSPLLLTPIYEGSKFTGKYQKSFLAPGRLPHLYHNTALLLPDGSVLLSGGNTVRAGLQPGAPQAATTVKAGQKAPNLDRIINDLYFYSDGQIGRSFGHTVPAEIWVIERFDPPYMFIDGARRTTIVDCNRSESGNYTFSQTIEEKTFYLMQSKQRYSLSLTNTSTVSCNPGPPRVVFLKLGAATHGWDAGQRALAVQPLTESSNLVTWEMPNLTSTNVVPGFYMLFYVDCAGKPTDSLMVRLDDTATTPL